MKISYKVPKSYEDHEIYKILVWEFKMSGVMIKRLKFHGTVNLNGTHATVREHVHEGDELYLEYGDTDFSLNKIENIPVLYEDSHYAVINKPAGIVTHPVHGHLDDSLLTQLSDHTLHPVMRLDRETSGLIIIAKDGYSHNSLHLYGNISKRYEALVYGRYDPEEGTIDHPIARRPNSVMIRDVTPGGKESVTLYKTLSYYPNKDISLVEFTLKTGRCHQIRVHSTYMGHPLLGDGLYGPNSIDNPNDSFPQSKELDSLMGRTALHAYRLNFTDPFTGEEKEFVSPLPSDMEEIIQPK